LLNVKMWDLSPFCTFYYKCIRAIARHLYEHPSKRKTLHQYTDTFIEIVKLTLQNTLPLPDTMSSNVTYNFSEDTDTIVTKQSVNVIVEKQPESSNSELEYLYSEGFYVNKPPQPTPQQSNNDVKEIQVKINKIKGSIKNTNTKYIDEIEEHFFNEY
ncbi:hypothetical protein EB118_21645, partial [bacterium]|nr:hypothetical protein [bacterium]